MKLKFKLISGVVYLCIVFLLVSLGVWQLDRAQQKDQLLQLQARQVQSKTLELTANIRPDMAYLKYKNIQATGHYDNAHQFLLDNQVSAGKVGYFVLTPFVFGNGTAAVLVNRGWVVLNPDRAILPDIAVTDAPLNIAGRINNFLGVGIKLQGAEVPSRSWPSVVQLVDSKVLSEKLGYALLPFQVELAADQANGYQRNWHTTTLMRPEQHQAYAAQWFALALLWTFLFFRYSCKKSKP